MTKVTSKNIKSIIKHDHQVDGISILGLLIYGPLWLWKSNSWVEKDIVAAEYAQELTEDCNNPKNLVRVSLNEQLATTLILIELLGPLFPPAMKAELDLKLTSIRRKWSNVKSHNIINHYLDFIKVSDKDYPIHSAAIKLTDALESELRRELTPILDSYRHIWVAAIRTSIQRPKGFALSYQTRYV